MKNLIVIAFATVLLTAATVLAIGPKIPCILTWTPSPSSDASGYWLYWRMPTGNYSDSQRKPLSTNSFSGFDMTVWGFSKGDYVIMMTATNLSGMESDPSVEVLWHYWNPSKPTNVVIRVP